MRGGRAGVLVVLTIVIVAGCGARSTLSVGAPSERDAGHVDDAGRDAGHDAGRDAGRDGGAILPCHADRDCTGTVCRASRSFRPIDLAPLPLVCGAADPGAPIGGDCIDRSECDRGLCAIAGACVMPCTRDADCPSGERCREVWVRTGAATMQSVDACTPVVTPPASVRVSGPEPGPTLSATGDTVDDVLPGLGPSALVVWTAPAGTTPFMQAIQTRDAAPRVVYDATVGGPGAPSPRWGVSPTTITDIVTLLAPNGPDTPVLPEGFTVTFGSLGGGETERVVLQRETEGTRYDLDAYLVGGGGWRSEGGRVPPQLARLIDRARAMLVPIGLTIGEVRVHEVVGGLRTRFEVLEGMAGPLGVPPDLAAMYELSAGARRPSAHVFFVRSIDGALGIASGIPGPHAMPGNGASGVAIAVDLTPDEQLPTVIVHEIGHFMGLFHTSEIDGSVSEPLTDTPECRADRDADGDGLLLPMECAGAGVNNVMFWAGQSTDLTPQQGEIMRRALFVQ